MVLITEGDVPIVNARSGKFDFFGRGGCESRKIPARGLWMSDDDYRDAIPRAQIERTDWLENAVLVERFNGSHRLSISLEPGSRNGPCSSRTTRRV